MKKNLLSYCLSLTLTALLCFPWASNVWADELTVADGTATNEYVPVYGYYSDTQGNKSQMLYLASDLASLADAEITGLTFYYESGATSWGAATFDVKLAEVENSTLTKNAVSADFTTVYSGALSVVGTTMTISFTTNFTYSGDKNLLIEVSLKTASSFSDANHVSFYGETVSGASNNSKCSYSSPDVVNFRPKTTFEYSPAAPITCPKPTDLAYSELTASSVKLAWTAGGTEDAWNVSYKAGDADWVTVENVTTNPYTLSTLTRATSYQVKVQAVCGEEDESKFSNVVSFDTPCDITVLPWSENFESQTGKNPQCWDNSASTTPYLSSYPERVWGIYSRSGNKSIRMYNYNVKAGTALINTPNIVLPTSPACELAFQYVHNASCGDFSIKISTDGGSTFSVLKALAQAGGGTADDPGTFQDVTIDLAEYAGETIMLQFFATADWSSGSIFVDNIDLHLKSSCAKPTGLAVGTTLPDGATFTWDEDGASAWQYIVVAKNAAEDWTSPVDVNTNAATVSGLAADTEYDFYLRTNCGGAQSNSTKVSFTPVCPAPTGVTVSAIGTTSATASWTAAAGITTYQYCVVEAGNEPTWDKTVDNVSVALDGLSASTNYDFYVRSYKNASSYKAAAKVNFRTACDAETAPWSEDFEDETANAVPACWSNAGSTATTSTTYGAPTEAIWAVYSYSSNKSIRMCNAYANTGVAQVTSPVITLPVSPAYEFKFDYAHTATCGNFKVQISTDGGASFTDLGEYGPTVASPSEYNGGTNPETFETDKVISLAAYSGNIVLRFVANANYEGGAIFIDNIAIREAPSCFKPATLAEASAITPDGATFSWTASTGDTEEYYQYICVATGETPDWATATKVAKAVENQAVVTGLAAGTYDFYVRSWCSESDQSEAVSKSFTTATIPAPASVTVTGITNNSASASWTAPSVGYTVQYQWKTSQTGSVWSTPSAALSAALSGLEANTEYTIYVRTYYSAGVQSAEASTTFTTLCAPIEISASAYEEHFDAFPACWDNSEGTTTNASYKWSSVSGGQSGKCVRFEGIENGYNKTNILASPLFTLNADADLTFYWKNAKTGDYRVKIAVDGVDREDLVTGLISNNAWQQKEVSLGAYKNHTIQLFFYGTSANDGNANLYLDELAITPQSCRKPAELNAATGITAEGATLTWTAGGANTDYQYAVAEAGQTPVWDAVNVVSATTVTLTGLQASTSYDFYVRTYCDAENQSEARKVSFRTGCGVITALPWEEDFESVTLEGNIPECWASVGDLVSPSYEWKLGNSYSGRNGGKAMQCGLAVEEAGKQNILATPSIQLGTKNMLTFWCKKSAGDSFVIEISADGGSSKTQLADLTSEALTDWTLKYVDLSAYNNQQVILYFTATSAGDYTGDMIYIDDVRVARGEVFADSEANESRFAELVTAGETMDVIFNRTVLCNGDYNTFCIPFNLSAEQIASSPIRNFSIKAFDYAAIENEELIISIMPASGITAGVPYFIANNTSAANQTVLLYKDVVITASTPGSKTSTDVTFQAVFNPVVLNEQAEGDSHNQLFLAAGNIIYWPAQNKTVKGFRAYFNVVSGGPLKIQKGMPARLVEHANTATGCENVNGENVRSMKVLENNQVIIIRNGVKYTIQGQKIQ